MSMKLTGFFSKTNARLGARFRLAGEGIVKGMLEVEEKQAQELLKKARRLSGHTAYKLGSMRPDYPYGHRYSGQPPTELYEANKQRGNLYRGWYLRRYYGKAGATFTVGNSSDESRFFAGIPTSRMKPRPLLQHLLSDDVDRMVREGARYYNEYVERYMGKW